MYKGLSLYAQEKDVADRDEGARLVRLHRRAGEIADGAIRQIRPEQWPSQSNCTEWTVRELVRHLVYENLWVPDLVAGKTIAQVGDRYEGDVLGSEPVDAWARSMAAANEAFEEPGALEGICHVSYGDIPTRQFIAERTMDLAVHGWDVGVSTGYDLQLDVELVSYLYDAFAPVEADLRASGLFGHKVEVPASAPLQTRLLGLLGRKEHWEA